MITYLNLWNLARKGAVGGGPRDEHDDELAEEEEEVHNTVENNHPHQVPHYQVESVQGRFAKVCTLNNMTLLIKLFSIILGFNHLHCTNYVCISVDKSHKLLQAPQAAFAHAQETPGNETK